MEHDALVPKFVVGWFLAGRGKLWAESCCRSGEFLDSMVEMDEMELPCGGVGRMSMAETELLCLWVGGMVGRMEWQA